MHAFDVQAHRGLSRDFPDNTLGAFEAALAVGVSTLELDVGVTRDGIVVVSHERRVSTLECRDSKWTGTPWKELGMADVATLARHDGSRVPTLADVLALIADHQDAGLAIDAKSHPSFPHETVAPSFFAARVCATVERAGLTARCSLRSFDWRVLVAAKRLLRELQTVALVHTGPEGRIGTEVPARAAAIGATTLAPRADGVTPDLVEAARAEQLAVVPWTVNERSAMERLLEWGVDGLTTDDPELLRDVLEARASTPLAA